ncbi:TetR/AcrR family transcriptional regulator [Bacillus infantis]|uniref:TetR/AcrR family transcriptional regulator n=1 Tax=Bacillus infantis TaxID=324767 RepID=UPI00101D3798|nr:TetR/AcrR family transcriptional regulator [Bacillus infantis]MCP1158717.1 TetR/AcrR family transcriptional regulator [Bacillus infantis]RYI29603.1 TetR/AcrR family transcriptional regulator [Bacillus infantis]
MANRGRKKGSIGKNSKNLLLKIAAEEFAEKGFHDAKISTIVKKAGLTQPSFYLYFPSKEAIFHELIMEFQQRLSNLTEASRIEPGVELSQLPLRIKSGLYGIFHFFNENQMLAKIGFFVDPNAESIKTQMAAQIHHNLLSEQRAGYFRENANMELAAASLAGAIERLAVTEIFTGKKSPDILAEEIVDLFLYGLINNKKEMNRGLSYGGKTAN